MDAQQCIVTRRSVRKFDGRPVPHELLERVVALAGDCDDDTLLVKVEQTGAACHTGAHSCFFNSLL